MTKYERFPAKMRFRSNCNALCNALLLVAKKHDIVNCILLQNLNCNFGGKGGTRFENIFQFYLINTFYLVHPMTRAVAFEKLLTGM